MTSRNPVPSSVSHRAATSQDLEGEPQDLKSDPEFKEDASPDGRASVSRRQILATGAALGALAAARTVALAAPVAKPVSLRPKMINDAIRVRMELVVKGNVHLAKNPLADRKVDLKLPVASDGVFDYEERFHRPAHSDAGDLVTYAERYYHEAGCDALVNKVVSKDRLSDQAKSVVVRRETLPEVIYSNDAYLTRDEVELLRSPVSSVAVDSLLPINPVAVGQKYFPSIESLSQVFNLTNVIKSDLGVTVATIKPDSATFEMSGKIDGSVDGVPTLLRVKGKMTFDRKRQTCSWLAVAVHETRDVSIAEPGFDLTATVKMIRRPMETPVGLPKAKPRVNVTAAIPRGRLMVAIGSDKLGFQAMMDRRWRIMSDLVGSAVMRMVDNDRSIAQCDFRPLPALPEGKAWTMRDFVADVTQTLGSQMKDIASKSQRVTESGVSVLQLVAMGDAEGVPIQWTLLHLTDSSGRRILATFTMEADKIDDFAGSDLQLAATMQFSTMAKVSPAAKMAQAGKKSDPTEKNRADGVQSASDLVR